MKSKPGSIFSIPVALLAFALIWAPPAAPDAWNKKTTVTFPESVKFPDGVVVPSGDYVMKLADSPWNRNIVQVLDSDESHVYSTFLAISAQRAKPADETVITFVENRQAEPLEIDKWFYPGGTTGYEFVYPKSHPTYIASAATSPAYAAPAPAHSPVAERESYTDAEALPATTNGATAPAAEPEPVELAQAAPAAPPEPQPPAVTAPPPTAAAGEELPATASTAPNLLAAAALLFGAAILVTATRRAVLSSRRVPPAGR